MAQQNKTKKNLPSGNTNNAYRKSKLDHKVELKVGRWR
jgi:hypothetical protein